MKCEICKQELAKNGVKNGVQYYYCTHCKKSYSLKNKKEPRYNDLEKIIAREMYLKCVCQVNDFTETKWTINQIARLLGIRYEYISKWVYSKLLLDEATLKTYLKSRNNGFDIACVLGYQTAPQMSENLKQIIFRKPRATTPQKMQAKDKDIYAHLEKDEYLRLVNMPITNRKEAIFVLGALLGCRTSEIIGLKFSDINYEQKFIHFHRTITFEKEINVSERNLYITNRKYPLTNKMLSVINWIKADAEKTCKELGVSYQSEYADFLCYVGNGFINSYELNRNTKDIQDKVNITTKFLYTWNGGTEYEKKFKFKWLRYTVKLRMLEAGVDKEDIKNIFGKEIKERNINQLEIMRKAYDKLDKYIDETYISTN